LSCFVASKTIFLCQRRKHTIMSNGDVEIEAKFYLQDLQKFLQQLSDLQVVPVKPRVHEMNLRFDWPDGSLSRDHRVLRLRKDAKTFLTYKGPQMLGQQVNVRQEIEFEVSDFEAARRFLEALGYKLSVSYEKFRAEYSYEETLIMVDELPYGNFVEIEGDSEEKIHRVAEILGLNWTARISLSYLALFDQLRQKLNLPVENLSFEELSPYSISSQDLNLLPAD